MLCVPFRIKVGINVNGVGPVPKLDFRCVYAQDFVAELERWRTVPASLREAAANAARVIGTPGQRGRTMCLIR